MSKSPILWRRPDLIRDQFLRDKEQKIDSIVATRLRKEQGLSTQEATDLEESIRRHLGFQPDYDKSRDAYVYDIPGYAVREVELKGNNTFTLSYGHDPRSGKGAIVEIRAINQDILAGVLQFPSVGEVCYAQSYEGLFHQLVVEPPKGIHGAVEPKEVDFCVGREAELKRDFFAYNVDPDPNVVEQVAIPSIDKSVSRDQAVCKWLVKPREIRNNGRVVVTNMSRLGTRIRAYIPKGCWT